MTDARVPRRAQVVLLDDRKLDFLVQPRLLSKELLDMVASHVNLHEKEYFGLYHMDDIGNKNWLSLDRKVLDHDLPRYADPIVFQFAVRFYVPNITYFREKITVEIFYLQAKTLIFKGIIHCECNVVFQLGSYVLQATFGDFTNECVARSDMKKVPILPTRTLKEHPSITYCEDKVIEYYRGLQRMKKGQAIVEYLNKFRSLPTYGVHYYEVKDKGNIPWWIGLSPKGLGVYDQSDKSKPRKVYKWYQIENLYFKERKVSIEVKNLRKNSEVSLDDGRQRSNSLGRRINGQNRVLVHTWYASTTSQAKAMWTMAISQHQFYLDKRDQQGNLTTSRTLEDIANELSQSNGSLNSSMVSVISDSSERSESGHSSNGGESNVSCEIAQKEMLNALSARKQALEMRLKEKIEELRQICFREATITGEYPPETPYNPKCSPPPVRKRVGTLFSLSDIVDKKDDAAEKEARLKLDIEIQSKITDAAEKLAKDPKPSKNVRKSRQFSYQNSVTKLKTMQEALKKMENQKEENELDGNSITSNESGVDVIKLPLSRRSSFEEATGQRRTSNASSMDGTTAPSRHAHTRTPVSPSSTEEKSPPNRFDKLRLNETPAFASSNKINEMLYGNRTSARTPSPGPSRLDSNSSISSVFEDGARRPPPPSYEQSRYSRRDSFQRSAAPLPSPMRRGSAPGVFHNHGDRGLQERRVNGVSAAAAPRNNNPGTAKGGDRVAIPMAQYAGDAREGSPSISVDSDYNSDDTQVARSPTAAFSATAMRTSYGTEKTRERLVSTSSPHRSNIVAAHYNHPSKMGIMSESESTGSYFLHQRRTAGNAWQKERADAYASTSALDHGRLAPAGTLPRSHHSSYSLHAHVGQMKRPALMNRFFNEPRGNHVADLEDQSSESLV